MSRAPPSPVVASSATIWATASKDWVVPAKPKPGRKPKKDPAPTPQEEPEALDSKGRRVQNRAAQRAFRERKQSQLAELQARVQQYEQGEIERNVALQSIAKRLKEENEKLRHENALLKEKFARLEQDRDLQSYDGERKRASSIAEEYPAKKKTKYSADPLGIPAHVPPLMTSYLPSPSSAVSSPDSNGSSISMHSPREPSVFSTRLPTLSNIFDLPSKPPGVFEPNTSFDFDCGFCNDETGCVCRELAMADKMSSNQLKIEPMEPPKSSLPPPAELASAAPTTISILDDLPSYQPPVPLRRRTTGPTNTAFSPVFPVTASLAEQPQPQPPSISRPTCSGDPSNCMACADDAFGKAFCAAVGQSVAAASPCATCPSRPSDVTAAGPSSSSSACCGDPSRCGRDGCCSASSDPEVMPTDDAWRQLKSHPNIVFADLSLLADVVARRSKCAGPRVEISPAPGSISPERSAVQLANSGASHASRVVQSDESPILLTDPHAHYRQRERERSEGSPPRLVPQEVLVSCGRQRVREVYADGVREALRLLDAKFHQS
ncbi:hypothetical protein NEOLEDRAFT_1152991 [Neolentinus lepideus HHB14362 ss-1]|uniref:BZIP domain-containing protein n=1 Tax=Neolentinus lepideus HHB14362 ss-1 TaxID=1314782 RepID=A0A165W0D7_9AGAM|nr:hypothetical protein NEOLEDRAFT_1152991 [Neolentinus lepideus HHB14362 ss-1]